MLKWYGDRVEKQIRGEVVKRLWKAALLVEADAKRLAPVDTGRLRASLTSSINVSELNARVKAGGEVDERQVTTEKGRARTGTAVFYAVFQELGTRFISPHPFLRPALDKNREKIRRLFGK